jgi:hypothetical protein
MGPFRFSSSFPTRLLIAALVVTACQAAHAGIFGKSQTPPQWGLDASTTYVPDYAKDAPAVILFDEYVETIDANGRQQRS